MKFGVSQGEEAWSLWCRESNGNSFLEELNFKIVQKNPHEPRDLCLGFHEIDLKSRCMEEST